MVRVIDEETGDEDDAVYESKGHPISNQVLEIKAPARSKWFTMRDEGDTIQFRPSFDFKDGREYKYDAPEDGYFHYTEAMKIIQDHAASGNDGPPMIYWSSLGGYSAGFELRKAKKKGAFQFRFVDAQVKIRSSEEYDDVSDDVFPW